MVLNSSYTNKFKHYNYHFGAELELQSKVRSRRDGHKNSLRSTQDSSTSLSSEEQSDNAQLLVELRRTRGEVHQPWAATQGMIIAKIVTGGANRKQKKRTLSNREVHVLDHTKLAVDR